MTMSDRSMHPDLVGDEIYEAPAAPEERPARGRGRARAAAPETTPAATSQAEAPVLAGEESEPAAPPEWVGQARELFDKDPNAAFALMAKNLPREQLEKDEVISGIVGHRADARARDIIRQQERDAQERAKLEAARNGDLYTLGELTAPELQQRIEQQAALQQAGPFMDGVVQFQNTLDPSVQQKVGGRTFGEGKGQAAGVAEYLQFLVEEGTRLGIERELGKRESAVRKSILSEVNGDEPVPERESGTPSRVREVTDEQIEAMTMAEYDVLFDENGRPKPGVRHRATRSIPLTQR